MGAVKTRLHKARAALQARLADLRREPSPMPATVPMRVADVRDSATTARTSSCSRSATAPGACRSGSAPPRRPRSPRACTTSRRPRPGTYRFAADLLAAAGAGLEEVRIVRLADTDLLRRGRARGGSVVDARPSDAINLALVAGAPMLVDEAVLAQAAEGEREIAEELAAALESARDARAIAADERERIAALPYGPTPGARGAIERAPEPERRGSPPTRRPCRSTPARRRTAGR